MHNSLKLTSTNIWDLWSNVVNCGSLFESNSPDILALCERNWNLIDSGNFSVRGYLPLIRKDSSTHIYGLTVYLKEGLSYVFDWLYFTQCLTSFSSVDHIFFFIHSFWFYLIWHRWGSLNQPICQCVCLWDFDGHQKGWLTNSGGTDRSGEPFHNFDNTTLLRWLTFLLRSQTVMSHYPALLDLFVTSDASICYTMVSLLELTWNCIIIL